MSTGILKSGTSFELPIEPPELYDLTLPVEAGEATAHELWQRFDGSNYGLHMDSQPYRYSQSYGYDRQEMVRDLGVDVMPRSHQYETGQYVSWLLQRERQVGTLYGIDDDQAALAVFTASIHDCGETTEPGVEAAVGATVGDIEFGYKTDADRETEARVRQFIFNDIYSDVPPRVMAKVEAVIAHKDHGIEHEIFEAAHALQTYATTIRARIAFQRRLAELLDPGNTNHPIDPAALSQIGKLCKIVVPQAEREINKHARGFVLTDELLEASHAALLATTGTAADSLANNTHR